MSKTDRNVRTAGRPIATRPRLWATASGLALGTALLAASPAAAQSCTGTGAVTCTAGTYTGGITYNPTSATTLTLNDPGIIVQGATGVNVSATTANTGDIVVNAANFGSVTATSSGVQAANAGTGGNTTATMGAGSITVSGASGRGLVANTTNISNAGTASATLNGGGITTTGSNAVGLFAGAGQGGSSAANAAATMTGGSIQSSGSGAYGVDAVVFNSGSTGEASASMSGGAITVTGVSAVGLASTNSGSGTALVRMSGGTIQSSQGDGIYGWSNGAGVYDVGVSGGTVTGGTGAAIRLTGLAGGTLAIGAGATINAGVSGVAVDETNSRIVNFTTAGTINGAINLSTSANTLTVTGGQIVGDVAGGGHTVLNFDLGAGNSFTYGAGHTMSALGSVSMTSGSAEIDGAISTAGALSVGGGALTFAGTGSTAASINVVAGSLIVQNGGAATATGAVDSSGTLKVSGAGSVLTAGTIHFGGAASSTATVQIDSGGLLHATSLGTSLLAQGVGSQVNIDVTGAGSRLNVDGTLGLSGTSTSATAMTISGGAAASIVNLQFGTPGTGSPNSIVTVTGAGSSLTSGRLSMYKGTLAVLDGGQVTVNGPIVSGAQNNGLANLTVSGAGAQLTTTGDVNIGPLNGASVTNSFTATLADGGVLKVGGAINVGGSTAARIGVLNIGGAAGGPAAGAGALDAAALTLSAGSGTLNFNHTDTNYSFGAAISGGGAINQVSGVTHLTGDSSGFTGLTTISGGELHVDGTLGASGGAVAVRTGGVLGGAGTIAGSVSVADGLLAPGDSPGTLTITGDLSLTASSHLSVQFGQAGVAGGPLNDLVKVNGNLTLDGTLDVAASPGGSFDPGVYRIVSYDGTLTDNGLTLGAAPAGSRLALQTVIAGQVNLVNYTGVPVNFWDGDGPGRAGDGVVQGGPGVWTVAGTNWTLQNGAFNAAYEASALAVFAAAPGTVTVSGPVSAAGMQFAADGYHLTGDPIALAGGASSTIRVGDGSSAGAAYVATIDNVLTGATTLNKTDLGTLILTGANTYAGGATITAGALQLGAGGTSGSITGDVADNGVLAFDRADAVTFAGAISGTGAVSQLGAGTTTLTGANSYAGGTTISAGVLKGAAASFGSGAILDNAALIIDQGVDATFAGPINGSGRFTKMGAGQLTLTGTGTLAGPTTVAAGALSVNGSLAASAVTVMSGATLKGSGAVGATTVQAGATIAPGNSIGVLHVNGAFVQQAGSTYQVEVDPTSSTASDQIVATGLATLQPGAGLTVVKTTAGNYHLGAVYTVLSAVGGVSGTYTLGGAVQPVSAFLALKDSYDAGHAYLTVVQTADPAGAVGTPNQGAVVGGLPSSGDLPDALLNSPTVTAAQQLLDQLAADGHAAARGALVSDSRLVRDLAIGRVQTLFCSPVGLVGGQPDGNCPEDGRPAAWGQVFGAWGRTDGDGNAGEANRSTGGFLLGADAPLPAGWRAGGFAGYSRTRMDMDGATADANIDSYHLGLYGGAQYGALGLRLGGSYSFHRIDADRTVALTNLGQQLLEASYDADTAQGFAQAGYRMTLGQASVEPFAEAAYVATHTQGFTEHGGVAALAARAGDTDAVFSTLGVKPVLPLAFGEVQASLHGLFGWRHDYGDVTPVSTVRFVAGGSPFSVEGAPLARDAAVMEVGLDMKNDNAVFGLTYGAQGWTHDFDQTVRANFRLAF